MHRIFSGDGWLAVLDIRVASGQAFAFESRFAEMDEPSHRHASRVTGASPKGAVRLSEKSPARHPPHRTIGAPHPGARASRPHAIPLRAAQFPCDAAPGHPAGGNGMGPAEAESWHRCRTTRVEEMTEAVPRLVRAGRPRSRVDFIP